MPQAQIDLLPLDTEVRVLLQRTGRGSHERLLRRAFLFERGSGLIAELQTAFIDHEFGLDAVNTQIAVLSDLRFFQSWIVLKARRERGWALPQIRAAGNEMPLSEHEVRDFARWCQRCAGSLAKQAHSEASNVVQLPGDDVVSTAYRNRRLRNVSTYLQWLIVALSSQDEGADTDTSATEARRRRVQRWFEKQLLNDSKSAPPRSLEHEQSTALATALGDELVFPRTDIGTRDRLIFSLLQQGLRAGELLKLQVSGINNAYRLNLNRTIGVVSIQRRPNDVEDSRIHEPSVKTRPGMLPIPKRLAHELVQYVVDMRRPSVDSRLSGPETPYLLVNHSGPHVGQPLSQRNLNRIVSKLKGRFGLPESLTPHAMRHTHFTELYDRLREQGRNDQSIRDLLVERGRWAPNSNMPARYTSRALMRESAAYVEERDSKFRQA